MRSTFWVWTHFGRDHRVANCDEILKGTTLDGNRGHSFGGHTQFVVTCLLVDSASVIFSEDIILAMHLEDIWLGVEFCFGRTIGCVHLVGKVRL